MASEPRSARDLTRSLTARARGSDSSANGDAIAVLAACERTFVELSRSLGAPGFGSLLLRARSTAARMHPLLSDMQIATRDPYLGGIPELVQLHGGAAVIMGLEALLDTMFSAIGGLIGLDIVARLVERGMPVDSKLVNEVK